MAIEYDLSQDITQNPLSLDQSASDEQSKGKSLVFDIPMPSVKPVFMATDPADRQAVAEANALGERLGIMSPSVGDLPKYRKQVQSQEADAAIAATGNQALANWYQNQKNNAVAQDDVLNATGLSDIINKQMEEQKKTRENAYLGESKGDKIRRDNEATKRNREALLLGQIEDSIYGRGVVEQQTGVQGARVQDVNPETGEVTPPTKMQLEARQFREGYLGYQARKQLQEMRKNSGDYIWSDKTGAAILRSLQKGAQSFVKGKAGFTQWVNEWLLSVIPSPVWHALGMQDRQEASAELTKMQRMLEAELQTYPEEDVNWLQGLGLKLLETSPQIIEQVLVGLGVMPQATGLSTTAKVGGTVAATEQNALAALYNGMTIDKQAQVAAMASALTAAQQIVGDVYGSARAQGASEFQAGINALADAAAQAPLENFSFKGLYSLMKASGGVGAVGKQLLAAMFREGGTEFLQQWPDEFFGLLSKVGTGGVNNEEVWDFFKNIPETFSNALEAGAIGAMWAPLLGMGAIRHAAHREQMLAHDKALFEALDASAANSKLRQELPEYYQGLVNAVTKDAPVQTLYIGAEDLRKVAVATGQDVYTLAQTLGVDQTAFDQAEQLGADVEVPLSLYQGQVAGTDTSLQLRGMVKTTPDGMTIGQVAAERAHAMKILQDAVKKLQENREIDAQLDEALEPIREVFAGRGVYTESELEPNLQVLKAYAITAAANSGGKVTPLQVLQRWGLRLEVGNASENEATLNQFLGITGAHRLDAAEKATRRLDNLGTARAMEKAGKDAKAIKMATGWERGADGKWRHEISDDFIDAEQLEALRENRKKYDFNSKKEQPLFYANLESLITDKALAKALVEAYGPLPTVYFGHEGCGGGEYDPLRNTIYLSTSARVDVLLHELQHFIQRKEGFSQGGDYEAADEYLDTDKDILAKKEQVKALEKEAKGKAGEPLRLAKEFRKAEKALGLQDSSKRMTPEQQDAYRQRVKELQEENPDAVENLKDILRRKEEAMADAERRAKEIEENIPVNAEIYRRFSGEVEARNVQSRIGMTAAERLASLASETEDVSREDQILLRDDLKSGMSETERYEAMTAEELNAELKTMDEQVDDILNREMPGPEVGDVVSLAPTLYQIQNIPEWRELTTAWMQAHHYTEEQIAERLAAMDGQLNLQAALAEKISSIMVGADVARRKSSKGWVTSGAVRGNIDPIYRLSFDLSSQCVKRLSSARTVNMVQKTLGRPLTAGEQMALIALYRYEGKLAPCLYCYVESNRRKATETVGVGRDVILSGNVPEAWSDVRKKLANAAIKEFRDKKATQDDIRFEYIVDEVASFTPEAAAWKKKFPKIANYLQKEADATKQNKAKPYEEYRGNFFGEWQRDKEGNVKTTKTGKKTFVPNFSEANRDELNNYAGFRFFSTSDFQIEHFVDLLQVFWDMQLLGVKSHAYTKVEDYVRLFGATGQKINMSCFAKEDPETGEIVQDTDQGWDWEKAKAYRKKHPDCGTIIVCANDKILDWAMKQDWIDYCIPFHYSGLSSDVYLSQGWQDFTSTQMEESFDAKPVVGVPTEQAEDIAERLQSGEITDAEASVEYAKILFENASYGAKMEDLFKPETLPENKGTAGSMRTAAKKKWKEMVESGTFDASDINPGYFRSRRASTRKDTAINPVDIHHVRMYEMGTQQGITDAQGVENYLKICAQERLIPVFPNFMWKDRTIADNAKERTESVKAAKQRWRDIVEDPKYGGHWEGEDKERHWVLSDEGWQKMWADIKDQVDPAFFKTKKDYARTDTPFNVPDPKAIDVEGAQKLLEQAFSAQGGIEEQYSEDPAIAQRLIDMIKAAEKTHDADLEKAPGKTPAQKAKALSNKIGVDALLAVRNGKDPWAAKTGKKDRNLPAQRPLIPRMDRSTLNQIAYHGTPHRFDQFTLDHIGEGEGAQAHGWGLYFTQSQEVGEGYRDKLTRNKIVVDGQEYTGPEGTSREGLTLASNALRDASSLKTKKGQINRAIHELDEQANPNFRVDYKWNREAVAVLEDLRGKDFSLGSTGQLFAVDIPENDVLLDEQKNLTDQPEAVRNALESLGYSIMTPEKKQQVLDEKKRIENEASSLVLNDNVDPNDPRILELDRQYKALNADYILDEAMAGYDVYNTLTMNLGSRHAASLALNDAGVKGITYDGRQDGRCFVIFDDQAINILETFYSQGVQKPAQTQKPAIRGAITFGDTETLIRVVRDSADLSTFAHEIGHLFVHDLEQMVERGEATDQAVKDLDTLKAFAIDRRIEWYDKHLKEAYGDKEFSELNAEQQAEAGYRAEQEVLAEAFLTYLKEGKAPSVELRGAFARFRNWLSNLFRALRGQGFSPVSDEVRAVFDRMLATDAQIEQINALHAATEAENAEIDRVAETMLTEQEQARLKKLRVNAENREKEVALSEALDAYWKASGELGEAREKIKAQVDAMPVYAAQDDAIAAGGIDWQSVVDGFGEEQAKQLAKKRPGLLRKEGGVDIDQVASSHGFTAAEFIEAVETSAGKTAERKALEDEWRAAREQELRKHFAHEEKATDASDEVFYSDERLSSLLMETTALYRAAGKKDRRGGNSEAVRAWARQMLAEMDVSSATNIARLSAAEAKAAREVGALLQAGKKEEAADAKRRQALCHAMVLEGMAFRDKRDAFVRKMARWNKHKIENNDQWKYQEQLRALAQRYRIGGRNRFAPERPDELKKLGTFIETATQDSVFGAPPFSDWLLDEKPLEKITVEQYREIMDAAQWLAEGMKPSEARLVSEGLDGTVQEAVDKAVALLEASGNKFKYKEEGTLGRKAQDAWRDLFAGLDNAQYVFMAADGYSEIGKHSDRQGFHSYLFRLVKDGLGRAGQRFRDARPEMERLAKIRDRFCERFEKAYGKRVAQINGISTPLVMQEVGRTMWTAEHIWCLARNRGNAGNLKTITQGLEIGLDELDALTSILTVEEWRAVADECALISSSYDDSDRAFRAVYGMPMGGKVEPEPFDATTADGTVISFPGWYFPISVDTVLSPEIGDKQEISAMKDDPNFTALGPSMKKGFTHARTGTSKPTALRFGVFEQGLWDQWRLIELGPIVRDVDRIMRNPQWRQAFNHAFGPAYYDQMREWLKYTARPSKPRPDFMQRVMDNFRSSATVFALGMNTQTFLRQFGGYPQALPDLGFAYLVRGIGRVAMHPIDAWKEVNRLSPMMADRDKNFMRELRDYFARYNTPGVKIGDRKVTRQEVQEAAMSLVTLGDRMTSYPIWMGAYMKGQDKGMSQADAIAYADGIVSKTQAVASEADLNAWQRDPGGVKRMFSMFMSETLRKGSRMRYWFHAWQNKRISTAEYCGHFASETFGVACLFLAMKALASGEAPDEKDAAWALFDEISGPVPILGNAISSWRYGTDPTAVSGLKGVNLIVAVGGKGIKLAQNPHDKDAIEGMFKAAVDLTAFAAGTGNVRGIYQTAATGWDEIKKGNNKNPFRLFFKGFKEQKK